MTMRPLLKTADQQPYKKQPKQPPRSTNVDASAPYKQPPTAPDPPKLKFKNPDPPNKVKFKPVKGNKPKKSSTGKATSKLLKSIRKDSRNEEKRVNNDSSIQPQ